MPSKAAGLTLRLALPLVSVLIFLGTGEVALRLIYPGGGRMTLGAPGFHLFEHLAIYDQQRGRLEWGEKPPGIPRVMILGDSITWGNGVRHWEDTWPEQLARQLEQSGHPHQFAVLALPGIDIDAHIEQFKIWAGEVRPEALIYQWYVNDIELLGHRPATAWPWHRFGWHEPLRRASYLYYFLDNRLRLLLRPPERSYVDYILTDFIPGSIEWVEFERRFHELATRAREVAPLRLLMLYPQVPFDGPYPLQPIHDRMKALARTTTISIPPVAWRRGVGTIVSRPDGPWKQAVRLPAQAGPHAIVTHGYYATGALDVSIRFGAVAHVASRPVATVELIDSAKHTTLTSTPFFAEAGRPGLQTTHLHLALPDGEGREVQLAIGGTTTELDVGAIDLQVDYGFQVLDLTDTLNTFDTHVSIFDAHPNPRAHRVIADSVARTLIQLERSSK
jgi:hypothetical protein